MKTAVVEGFFPELKGANIYKTGRDRGSNAKTAISRAFGDLLKQVRGKRVHTIKATITIMESAETRSPIPRCLNHPKS